MSTPDRRASRPRPRAPLAVQLGQTLFFLGVAVLVLGLFLDEAGSAPLIGGGLALVGAVLFVVGLRRRPRGPSA